MYIVWCVVVLIAQLVSHCICRRQNSNKCSGI